ncbi:MAG: hypothetical protein GXP40_02515 [Chloroflexi bacterium]|nr:hypothetical protein [Chloroflexota bacterium]
MEFEQIVKQLEWLDEEHRKDKVAISGLEERLAAMESSLDTLTKQIKRIHKEFSGFSTVAVRLEQFDEFLAQQRREMNQTVEDLEKKAKRREREARKRYQEDLETINKALADLHERSDQTALKKTLKSQADENLRLNQAFSKLRKRIDDILSSNEEIKHAHRLFEENRRQDAKRLTDTQGELTALRKRIDEQREKLELNTDNLRNLDARIAEVLAAEAGRKKAQNAFLEQQSLAQIERERAWKEWLEKYETFQRQTESLEIQLQAMDKATRAAQKAQETFTELSQRTERRVNEITEMQRLAEDRLRQEWVSFKADEQKRWTGYSLSQDETLRDLRKAMEKLEERLTALDDSTQTLHDQLQQTTDATEQQMQELMNWAHEWLTAYERVMGHARKTR